MEINRISRIDIAVISIIGILLIIATISAFSIKNSMDFGITRIISVFTSVFFIFACVAYGFTRKLSAFFYFLTMPVFLFLILFGNDIPIFIRVILLALYCYWGYTIVTSKGLLRVIKN
jgi:hypothetical protein